MAGGFGVDVFFLISGVLLGRKLRLSHVPVVRSTLQRVCRVYPTILVLVVAQQVLTDRGVEPGHREWNHVYQLMGFFSNYQDCSRYGTFTMTVAWSVVVDFHVGLVLTLLSALFRKVTSSQRSFEKVAGWCFGLLFLASFAVRYLLLDASDPDHYSLPKMGELAHFGNGQTKSSVAFFARQYNHTVPYLPRGEGGGFGGSISDDALYVHSYLNRLYMPTHARFGPMALGATLAFLLPAAEFGGAGATKSTLKTAAAYASQLWAVLTLGSILIPQPEGGEPLPGVAVLILTTALRNLVALATAVLLYGALSPPSSSFHAPRLAAFWSWRGFATVASCSYALNMFHFRVLMDVTLASRRFGPSVAEDHGWLFAAAVFSIGGVIALLLSVGFQRHVEPVATRFLRRLLGVGASQKAKTQ